MSNPVTPGTPGRVAPTAVRVSSILLYVAAAAQVIGAVVGLSTAGTYREVYEEAFASVDGGEAIASVTAVSVVVGAVVGLLLGAGFIVLAIFNNRGKNASRIVTWVIGGLSVCCGGFGLISLLTGGTFGINTPSAPGQPSPEELSQVLEAALPGWYLPVVVTVTLVGLLSLVVAVILLALPPANEYFRKPPPDWEPPAPGYQPYQG